MAFPVETVAVLLFLFECGCSSRHCGLLEAGSLEPAFLLLATGWFLDRAFSFLSLSMRVRMQLLGTEVSKRRTLFAWSGFWRKAFFERSDEQCEIEWIT